MTDWYFAGYEKKPFPVSGAVAYVGPNDVVSGCVGFWGLRGVSAAYSTGSNPAIDIQDVANANPATINILSTGALDMVTLNAWIAAHGTAFINKYYDQIGTNHLTDVAGPNLATHEPSIVVGGSGVGSGLPSAFFNATTLNGLQKTFPSSIASQPYTVSVIMRRNTVLVPSFQTSRVFTSNSAQIDLGFPATQNQIAFRSGGGRLPATAPDDAYHAVQAIFNDAVQSALYIDTTVNNLTLGDTTLQVTSITSEGDPGTGESAGNAGSTANVLELGVWPSAFSTSGGGQASLMSANQLNYWGYS